MLNNGNYINNDYITTKGIIVHYNQTYVNTLENEKSSYILDYMYNRFELKNVNANLNINVEIILQPKYALNKYHLSTGELVSNYVNTHGDRIRIQPISGCQNNCKFCSLNEIPYIKHEIFKLDKAFKIAINDKNVKHALISGGSPKNTEEDYKYLTDVYTHFATNYKDFEFDIMMTPRGFKNSQDTKDYENYITYLKNIGINGLSINIELYNNQLRQKYIPQKNRISLDMYIDFIKKSVKVFEKNKIRSSIIVGLEPLEDMLKGIEMLCDIGCIPVLSPYIPNPNLDVKMPSIEFMLNTRKKAEEIVSKYNIALGPLCDCCKHNTI